MTETKRKAPFFRLIIVLLIIGVIASALLAIVNEVTYKRIEEISQQKLEASMQSIQPEAEEFQLMESETYDLVTAFYEARQNGEVIGYCIETNPSGFGGKVRILTGIDLQGAITGVRVVEHTETVGVGSKCTLVDFLDQFSGKDHELDYSVPEDNIDSVSGATITSKAVLRGINAALAAYEQEVGA